MQSYPRCHDFIEVPWLSHLLMHFSSKFYICRHCKLIKEVSDPWTATASSSR